MAMRVLVLEDITDEVGRFDVYSLVLKHAGHELVSTNDIQDIPAILHEQLFDLLIIDAGSNNFYFDAVKLCKTIRADQVLYDFPIVFVIRKVSSGHQSSFGGIGVKVQYLFWPVGPQELLESVNEAWREYGLPFKKSSHTTRRVPTEPPPDIRIQEAVEQFVAALEGEGTITPRRAAQELEHYFILDDISQPFLKDYEGKQTIDFVRMLRQNEDKYVRGAAARVLGQIGDSSAVKPLVEVLRDRNPNVRIAAAQALGCIRDKRAVAPLIEAVRSEHIARYLAAKVLGNFQDERAARLLIEMLSDEFPVSQAASKALRTMKGQEIVEVLLQAMRDDPQERKHILNILLFVR